MEKYKNLKQIRDVFLNGGNVIKYLKSLEGRQKNNVDDILISYDFQSGQYIKNLDLNINFKIDYCQSLANRINEFEDCNSILEIGIGEATTLGVLKGMLKKEFNYSGGFDISWSRLNFAKSFLFDIGYFYFPFAAIVIIGSSNAVNLTDGLDGLATVPLILVTLTFILIVYLSGNVVFAEYLKIINS